MGKSGTPQQPDRECAEIFIQRTIQDAHLAGTPTKATGAKYYFSGQEKEVLANGNTREVSYITAPDGLCAMYVNDNGNKDLYYVYTDHLGSINRLVSDNSGSVIEQSFDPWGRSRNPNTWDFAAVPQSPAWLTRGYTGHEHLPQFHLINMNGRFYDPLIARMLSPDNEVTDPTSTQTYNRYSYAFNNPLKFIDPTGNNGAGFITGGKVVLSPGSSDFSGVLAGMRGGSTRGFTDASGEFTSNWTFLKQQLESTLAKGYQPASTGTQAKFGRDDILMQHAAARQWTDEIEAAVGFIGELATAPTFTGTPGENKGAAAQNNWWGGWWNKLVGVKEEMFKNKEEFEAWRASGIEGAKKMAPYLEMATLFIPTPGSFLKVGKFSVSHSAFWHIFKKTPGHVNPATLYSKGRYLNLFKQVASNPNNLVKTVNPKAAKAGVQTYRQVFKNGKQVWVEILNNEIRDAGINLIPK